MSAVNNNLLTKLIIIIAVAGLFVGLANLIRWLLRRWRSGARANRERQRNLWR